ncbi:hypothetical protein LINGRAHAP2_LOCUS4538 [Linum grandiflorum]
MEKLFSRWFCSNTRRRITHMAAADRDAAEKSGRRSLKNYLYSSNSTKQETVSNPEKLSSETNPPLVRSQSFSEPEYTHPRFSTSYWMGSDSKEEQVIPFTVDDIVYGAAADVGAAAGSLTSTSSGSSSVAGSANRLEEKHRLLRERVGYLAEQNVLLQKEISKAKSGSNCSEEQDKYRSAEEDLGCFRIDLDNALMTSKDYALLKIELQAEELLTSLMKKNLYAKELQVQQLQAEMASLNNHAHKSEDFAFQMLKKNEMMAEVEQELLSTKEILQKVAEERDMLWEEVNKYKEMNMLLKSEVGFLKKKVDELDEEVLVKEGEITILRDSFWEKRPSFSL